MRNCYLNRALIVEKEQSEPNYNGERFSIRLEPEVMVINVRQILESYTKINKNRTKDTKSWTNQSCSNFKQLRSCPIPPYSGERTTKRYGLCRRDSVLFHQQILFYLILLQSYPRDSIPCFHCREVSNCTFHSNILCSNYKIGKGMRTDKNFSSISVTSSKGKISIIADNKTGNKIHLTNHAKELILYATVSIN